MTSIAVIAHSQRETNDEVKRQPGIHESVVASETIIVEHQSFDCVDPELDEVSKHYGRGCETLVSVHLQGSEGARAERYAAAL